MSTSTPENVVGAIHVHSDYSRDGLDSLEHIRDSALGLGIRFVAMTDHAEDFDDERFAEYREACAVLSNAEFLLIPGLEFRFAKLRGLHLLACGLDRLAQPATLEAFAHEVANAARLTVLAHPVLTRYRVPGVVRDCIDAVEVWNASYNTRYLPDPRAMALLRTIRETRPAVVGVAGLDQHDAGNDRRTRVVLTKSEDLADPLVAIREGRFRNRGQTMSFASDGDLSPMGFSALVAVRALFDRIERTQERVVRRWRRTTGSARR